MQAFRIENEEQMIDLAIKLDQSKESHLRARARALRGIAVPLMKHIHSERQRWTSADEFGNSVSAMSDILGAIVFAFADGVVPKEKRTEFAAHFLDAVITNVAATNAVQNDYDTATSIKEKN